MTFSSCRPFLFRRFFSRRMVAALGLSLVATSLIPTSTQAANAGDGGAATSPAAHSFTLPETASTLDLIQTRLLPESLIPVGKDPTDAENAALATALRAYAKKRESQVLADYLQANATSPWFVAVATNLGLLKYQEGYFSSAMTDWDQAWTLGKDATDPRAQAVVNRAVAELIRMDCRVGRIADTEALLKAVSSRSFHGVTANMIEMAQQAVLIMKNQPAECFKCGPFAIRTLLSFLKEQTPATTAKIKAYATTAQGTSLAQVEALAGQVGLKLQVAKRVSGTELPLPAIVNWKLTHYGALLKASGDRYLLTDPTFGTSQWIQKDAVTQEASGYFLIPAGPLPKGWVAVDDKEAGTVWGRGYVTSGDGNGTGGNDDDSGGGSGGGSHRSRRHGTTAQRHSPKCLGMANWSFHTMLASLHISDVPAVYEPPVGPAVECYVTYDASELNQPSVVNYANLGPLWNFSWQSSITLDSVNAYVAMGTGGTEVYTNYNDTTKAYDPEPQAHAVLTQASPGIYERRSPDGSKMVFSLTDPSARIYCTEIWDAQGNKVVLSYDGNFRLTKLTDAAGQVSTISYGSNVPGNLNYYLITTFQDPFGRKATFSYDASGRLVTITDVIGMKSQMTYGDNDFITKLTTPYGSTTFSRTLSPDGNITTLLATEPTGSRQRLDSVIDASALGVPGSEAVAPAGMNTFNGYLVYRDSFYWDRKAMQVAPGDYSKAFITHFLHDVTGTKKGTVVESEKAALENRVWYAYQNQNGGNVMTPAMLDNPIAIGRVLDDGTTQLEQNTYNALGFKTQHIDPLGRTRNITYASNGIDPISITQQSGNNNYLLGKYTWNTQHLPLKFTDQAGETTTFTYNAQGQVTSVTDPRLAVWTFAYNAKGYLTSIDGPLAGTSDRVTYAYDGYGRVSTTTNGDGYTQTYAYDALDRVTTITYPDGTFEKYSYTNLDETQYRDRLGRVTKYAYNSLSQLTSVTDPLSRVTAYDWCTCGSLKGVIDPLGRITHLEQDVMGRPLTKKLPDGSVTSYVYEQTTSRLHSVIDGRGQSKTMTYNVDDSVATIAYSGTVTPGVSFTYDPIFPRVTSMTDGIGKTAYTYNAINGHLAPGAGQVAKVVGPWTNETVTYTYDELGRTAIRSINGLDETYTFDPSERLTSVSNFLGTFGYGYEAGSGRVNQITYPNGQISVATYLGNAADNRLTQIKNLAKDGSLLSQFDYAQNVEGDITSWNQQLGTLPANPFTFSYDAVNRLTAANSPAATYGYGYDGVGNRTSQTINGTTSNASYNFLNELQQVTPALGNDRTYTWDAENRLIGIAYTGTNLTTQLSYDGSGRCAQIVEKTGTAVTSTKRFVWCGEERCEERNASNVTTRRFNELGEQIGTAKYFYTTDHQGSVREMTDANGALHARYSYDPYGNRTKLEGDLDASYGFTDVYQHTPSQLGLTLCRPYDATTGRWVSRDPLLKFTGVDPERYPSPNLYQYCESNPVRYTDTTGLDIWIEGPSPKETSGHQSICVGNPNGSYEAYSFGLLSPTETGKLNEGAVYRDVEHGGKILAYKFTNCQQDAEFKAVLEGAMDRRAAYGPFHSLGQGVCRDYAQRRFDEAPGVATAPPQRARLEVYHDWDGSVPVSGEKAHDWLGPTLTFFGR